MALGNAKVEGEKAEFEDNLRKVQSEGFLVGKEDATGQDEATNAEQYNERDARIIIVKDEDKYTIQLGPNKSGWALEAKQIGDILGYESDVEDWQEAIKEDSPQDVLESEAEAAARRAGGRFVPGDKSVKAGSDKKVGSKKSGKSGKGGRIDDED